MMPVRWLPALAWMGVIFWLSSQQIAPPSGHPLLDGLISAAAHVVEYGTLALLLHHAVSGSSTKRTLLTFGLTMLYAITDEWHQSFVPTRDPSLLDLTVDAISGAIALMAIERTRRTSAGLGTRVTVR
jgi:VanZ family protein